jgi:RNA-directed DNA polymerase
VGKYTDCRWVLLYLGRWLRAPVQREDGTLAERNSGTPQGGVVSPLLANIFLHHAFDRWMRQTLPRVPFERYADDIVIHCRAKAQAEQVRRAVQERLQRCRLALHPEKTKIVYCKDTNRRHRYPDITFDFLGFTFRPRLARNRQGTLFVTFTPAVSRRAARDMRQELRTWRIFRRSDKDLSDLANMLNPTLRGWIGYYGSYRKSELGSVFHRLNFALVRWARAKYRLGSHRQAGRWLKGVARREPALFAHWHLLGIIPTVR